MDCESTWMLRSWLRERQRESGIDYLPDPLRNGTPPAARSRPRRRGGALLAAGGPGQGQGGGEPKEGRLDQLVGWLVEFHRREEKPMWWRMFDRHEMTVEELFDDRDCLAGLTRTERAHLEDQAAPRGSSTATTRHRRPSSTPGTSASSPARSTVPRSWRWTRTRAGGAQGRTGPAARPAVPHPGRACRCRGDQGGDRPLRRGLGAGRGSVRRRWTTCSAGDRRRIAGHDGGMLVGADGDPAGAARRARASAAAEHALHPGPAGHGEDLHGRGGDRGAAAARQPGRRHRAEPQGHPQPHGRGRSRRWRGRACPRRSTR